MPIARDERGARRRRPLPSGLTGLAALACAACCAVPLLVAAGVLGGGTVAAFGRLLPGAALGLAALAGLAWWWALRGGRHRRGCPGVGACSCGAGGPARR